MIVKVHFSLESALEDKLSCMFVFFSLARSAAASKMPILRVLTSMYAMAHQHHKCPSRLACVNACHVCLDVRNPSPQQFSFHETPARKH